jgi:hypothetical protein
MKRRAFLTAVAALPTIALAVSPPRAAKSKHLMTTLAGFDFGPEGARFTMGYLLRSFPLPDLHVVSTFENPADGSRPLTSETKVDAGLNEFRLDSPVFNAGRFEKLYRVQLSVYADPEKSKLWATHSQKVLLSFPPQLIPRAKELYNFTVL